jgi:hypothetical protein
MLSANTQSERVLYYVMTTYKNVGACICLFCIQAYHSLEENRQRNTHVEVYRYTVKCAYEDTRILAAHYGEYILHPVELPLQCSCPHFDVVVRIHKNKATVTPSNM